MDFARDWGNGGAPLRRPDFEAAKDNRTDELRGHDHSAHRRAAGGTAVAGDRLNGMVEQASIDRVTADPDTLLAACRQRAAAARHEVVQIAGALSGHRGATLTDRQRAQIGNMLRRLVGEIEATLSNGFTAAIERRDDLGRDALADFVTMPPAGTYEQLAAHATMLDPPLVEAALHRMLEHALETDLRPSVADAWHAGRETDSDRTALTARWSERLAGESLRDYMVDRAGRTDGYGEPVLRLADLDPAMTATLYWHLAAMLRRRAAAAFDRHPLDFDREIQRLVQGALETVAERTRVPSAAARAVEALAREQAPDGALAVEALSRAEIPLFFAVFARLTGLRQSLLRRLVFDADGLGFAIAARAAGLAADQFVAAYRMTRHGRARAQLAVPDDSGRIAALFERISARDATRVCDYWRLPPAYLEAVWRASQPQEARARDDRA